MFCLCVCLYQYVSCAIGDAATGVIDGCEPPCGGWELYLGPLEEQLLVTELSFFRQRQFLFLLKSDKWVIENKADKCETMGRLESYKILSCKM